jgi:hypothetical protein
MRTFILPGLLLAIAAAGAPVAGITSTPSRDAEGALLSRSAASCENVRGTLSGNAFVIWGLTFDGDIGGPGTLLAEPALNPRGRGAIHLATLHAIDTGDGMIFTADQGVLAPVAPPVYRLVNRYNIAGGTGGYEDATGFMHVNALVSLATGELEGTYHGRICR